MNSVQLHNRIRDLRNDQADIAVDAEDREIRMSTIQGEINALDAMLAEAIENEAAVREAAPHASRPSDRDFVAQLLGPRAEFSGIDVGFQNAITMPEGPSFVDPTLPGTPALDPGFVDTIMQSPTNGAVEFYRRTVAENRAGQWKDADGAKPESNFTYVKAVANLAWIGHHTPITRTQASNYSQLDAIMRGEMMIGLNIAKNREALIGNDVAGIVGVTNTVGILTSTVGATENLYDRIRRDVTRVARASKFRPTHIAMTTVVKQELDLLKGDDGHYLLINVDGSVWGLRIVEDDALMVTDATQVHEGYIVYAQIGATWYTAEEDNLQVGLINDQLIKNAYTLLAESRNALAVKYPNAFCYVKDAIPAVAI